MMRSVPCLGIVFTALASPLLGEGPTTPRVAQRPALSAVVDQVLSRSPAVARAKERVHEAEAGLSEARLSRLPRLSAKSVATRGDDPVYAFGSLLEQRRFGPRNFAIDALNDPGYLTNVRSSLELGVPLFTGFELSTREELGRWQVEAAGAGENASAQETRYQVLEAYLRLILSQALIENAGARIDSAAAGIEDARRLKARGLVLGSDFYAAEAALAGLRAAKVRAQSSLSAAQATLAVLTGSDSGQIEPLGSLQEPRYALDPLPALVDGALRDRQDLKQAAAAESSAGALKRQASLSLLPKAEAFASLDANTSDFGSNATNRLVGVRAELPIGDPAYFARKARAEFSERAARANKQSMEEDARIEVSRRYQAYQGAVATLPILRESADKADQSLELFRPLYREGRQSILDVLRAEEALMKAKAGYLEAVFEAHAGYARLELAAGRLDDAAIQEIEGNLGGRP